MRLLAALAGLALAMTACGSTEEKPAEDPQANTPEGKAPSKVEGEAPAEEKKDEGGAVTIRHYKDLEEYSGQQITLEGILKVYPKFKGRHGMLILDSGLVVYVPHAELFWRGENWWLHEGKRCRLTGKLHTYVSAPIDGMNGPFLDEPTYPDEVGKDPDAQKEGVPKKASNE